MYDEARRGGGDVPFRSNIPLICVSIPAGSDPGHTQRHAGKSAGSNETSTSCLIFPQLGLASALATYSSIKVSGLKPSPLYFSPNTKSLMKSAPRQWNDRDKYSSK